MLWNSLTPMGRFLAILLGGYGAYRGIKYAIRKRIFISFAIEDVRARDLLIGQARNGNTPFEFTDMSVQEPWDSAWKTKCRERIKECDGVIVLVTKNTIQADGVRWEIKCAQQENIPVMLMYANNNDKGCRLPPELAGKRVYDWTWPNLKKFVSNLN